MIWMNIELPMELKVVDDRIRRFSSYMNLTTLRATACDREGIRYVASGSAADGRELASVGALSVSCAVICSLLVSGSIMGSPITYFRYLLTKIRASFVLTYRNYELGNIKEEQIYDHVAKIMEGKLTFKRLIKGSEMTPTFASQGETLLIRSLPRPSARSVFVGDVVMLKDPENSEQELVRRVAALEGDEMLSSKEDEASFKLKPGTCWVLCDNESLSPKEALDSRTFGPLPLSNIVGRAIYCSRSRSEHGFVQNSDEAMHDDSAVLAVELDVEEMTSQS